ncbi:sigma-70 family RNA polymerase sigma factor [Candidatus Poribacteria bacterium]|nr:sigma-70 family RNA polymerase sigma factor [Candidatus Poribacteria bacterium]
MQAQLAVLTAMGNSTITDLIPQEVEESSNQQENDLIKRCQSGDQQAMEQIVRQYQNQVYNIAYGMLRNSEDAQDIMQEVFLRVWDKIRQFQFKSRFSTWLYRIVKNLSINEKNRQRRRQTSPMEMDDSQAWVPIDTMTPEKEALLVEKHELMKVALAQLKKDYRTILVLREMETLSYEELSEVLGCSLGRVKSRLHEARMELRNILKQLDR